MSDPIDVAVETAKRTLLDDPLRSDVHSVYRGLIERGGSYLKDAEGNYIEGVVCVVGNKRGYHTLSSSGMHPVPQAYVVDGQEVLTDVQVAPPPEVARLDLKKTAPFAANEWQECFNCPIPGGAQIAPRGANWVGTLGGAMHFGGIYGALTNYHVAVGGQFGAGAKIDQPFSGSGHFGFLKTWKPINFRGQDNLIDAALIDCTRTDGDFFPLTHTVRPYQHGLGPITPEAIPSLKVGSEVVKVGRTTGLTAGMLVGTNNTTSVNYGPEGTARFVKQYVFRSNSGQFSNSGDSGSLILDRKTLRPVALLFAGGGRDTIANPIQYVLDWCKGKFFQA